MLGENISDGKFRLKRVILEKIVIIKGLFDNLRGNISHATHLPENREIIWQSVSLFWR